MIKALVVAGVSSGVGKTTVAVGLLEAFRRLGLRVQAFKVGPDFIDPGFHAQVTGRPSYNLDGWICSRESAIETVAKRAADADLALIEGVMGCFDGIEGKSEEGSTAQIAKWLGAPVVLVIDSRAISRSAGAVVLGFERFDPELELAGVIFNRVAGETHFRWLSEAVEGSCRAVPLGFFPRRGSLAIPERHLGLVTAAERRLSREFLDEIASVVEESFDLDRLLSMARSTVSGGGDRGEWKIGNSECGISHSNGVKARIGVALDEAFQFYYQANFDLLKAAGAELVFWSPLNDSALPSVDGLYIGGGYPEIHAKELSANETMRREVKAFVESGRPLYAECGGLMYLCLALEDLEGKLHPMAGVLQTTARMRPGKLTLGYTEVEFSAENPLAPAGTVARGHEFHYSRIDEVPASVQRVYRLRRLRGGEERAEGYLVENAVLSYVHLHFESNPLVAERFVSSCIEGRRP
jgi:cobyrinic acid a,c-diamide synthase